MKILFHCVYFPPEVGGLESHVYYLARALVERGHRVQVVTSRSLPGVPEKEEMEGIEVWRTWFPSRSPAGVDGPLPGLHSQDQDLGRRGGCHPRSGLSPRFSRPHGPATVGGTHGGHLSHLPLPDPGRKASLAADPGDAWCACPTMPWLPAGRSPGWPMALAPGAEVEALANGVETEFFRRWIRRFPPRGGQAPDHRSAAPFPEERRGVLHPGPPPDSQRGGRRGGSYRRRPGAGPPGGPGEGAGGCGPRCSSWARRPHSEMPGLLSSGDLAVIPSLMEATSVAALEAMACELPVAASRVGGLPEIVERGGGRPLRSRGTRRPWPRRCSAS